MKRIVAALITVALLAMVLIRVSQFSSSQVPSQSSTPQDCIQRMFEAAEQGDVDTYLSCFTGPERQRLERELIEQDRTDFGQSLVAAVAKLKGRVVLDPKQPESANRAQLIVERIYANHNEKQAFELVQQLGTWRVSSVRTLSVFQPAIPYGTPVYQTPKDEQSTP